MPLPLILAILAGATALIVFVVKLLGWERIKDWFVSRRKIKQEDKNAIAVTIKEKLDNGHYEVVQGIFNTETDEFMDGIKYEAENLDEQFANIHKSEEMVIYN